MEGELTKIADLLPESEAIIEGDILFVETRLIRDGKDTLLTFGITDYTSSIKCKKFLKGTVDELLEQIKKGKRFKVRGRNTYDAYAREYTFHVLGVQETHKTELMDEAEHKTSRAAPAYDHECPGWGFQRGGIYCASCQMGA